MGAEIQDVLLVDVAFPGARLLAQDHEAQICSEDIGSELIPERIINVNIGSSASPASEGGLVWRLPRERALVESSPSRSRVAREYPHGLDEAMRITRIAASAIRNTDLGERLPTAFGFNFQAIYKQSSEGTALRYLGKRIFRDPGLAQEGWEQVGGQGKFVFKDGRQQWTVAFEPRLQNATTPNVYIAVNLHIAESRFPAEEEMKALFESLWEKSHEMIAVVDRSE